MNSAYMRISQILVGEMNAAAGITAYSSLPKKLPGYHLNTPDPPKKSPKSDKSAISKKTKDKYRI